MRNELAQRHEIRLAKAAMSLSSDIRHALRGWRSSPGFTLVALATLAIGIGATTAIWSVVYGVLLRPLPFPEADRVIFAAHSYRSGEFEAGISATSFLFVKEQQKAFEKVAAITGWDPSVMLGNEPQRISGAIALFISGAFLLIFTGAIFLVLK